MTNQIVHKIGVYILRCSNGRFYIGSTNDKKRRLREHQEGLVKATKNILPVTPVFFQSTSSLTEARTLEYALKSKKSRVIIENIIADGYIKFYHKRA